LEHAGTTLGALLAGIDADLSEGAAHARVLADVVVDSREVRPGSLFVAMSGALADGHDYLGAAARAGASAALVERGRAVPDGLPFAAVDDPRAVLGAVASAYYGRPSHSFDVVGVTGTNGKTTTTYMLESICAAAGLGPGVVGTVSYRWPGHEEPAPNTTPGAERLQRLLARMRDAGSDVALMEVSSHGLSTHRLDGTRVQVGVYTNLTQDHLDFHGTMEAYRDAKARLFLELLPAAARAPDGAPVAVLNADDPEGVRLAGLLERDHPGVEVWTYAVEGEGRWSARDVSLSLDGVAFRVARQGQHDLSLSLPMLGSYNVSNALAAACAASALGVSDEDLAAGLAAMAPVPGRLERVGSRPAVFVDYAHTPDALERSLETLREVTAGQLVAVFGCGGDRDRDKRPKMGRAAELGADRVWVTSDNPRSEPPEAILADIVAGMQDASRAEVVAAREDAIARAVASAAPDDVVLIAGKGHETYQEVAGVRRPFDDREHAQQALARRDETGGEP
jgi:UDP-N-acetylmuramyl-tripeptide synthetase